MTPEQLGEIMAAAHRTAELPHAKAIFVAVYTAPSGIDRLVTCHPGLSARERVKLLRKALADAVGQLDREEPIDEPPTK